MPGKVERITEVPKLPPRRREGHKGEYGRVLVVGGSRGMVGAVALTANAALRGGAGLVTFAAPETVQLTIAALCPCATSLPLSCDESGLLGPESVREMLDVAKQCDVLAVGPGFAVGVGQQNLVLAALQQQRCVVLDADGLNNLAHLDEWWARRNCPVILTPHPGEFSRLTGKDIAQIQSDREGAVLSAMGEWTAPCTPESPPFICVLKGAGTIVSDTKRLYVNQTGNPGMASGGSGDVLTGLIAALLGQGLEPFEAASLGVHLHGRAGDLAAQQLSEASLIASDILGFLPQAMIEVVE